MKKTWVRNTLVAILALAMVLGIASVALAAKSVSITGAGATDVAVNETRTLGVSFAETTGTTTQVWSVTGPATLDGGTTSTSATPSLKFIGTGTVTVTCTGSDDGTAIDPVATVTYRVYALSVDSATLTLTAGQANHDMTSHVRYAEGDTHTFTLSSSDTSVVSIVDGVKLKAEKKGTATVTVSSGAQTPVTVAVTVNGKDANLQITSPSGNSASNPLKIARGSENKASVSVSTDSDGVISWTSSDAGIASVPNENSKTNQVTGNSASSNIIEIRINVEATTQYEAANKVIYVQVYAPVNITGVPEKLTIPVGETKSFIADTNSSEFLVATSDDASIASIVSYPTNNTAGTIEIKGVKTGTTKVRVKAGATEKVVNVTVGNPTPTITLTFDPDVTALGYGGYTYMNIHVDNPYVDKDGYSYVRMTRGSRRIYVEEYNYSHPSTMVYWARLDSNGDARVLVRPQYSGTVKLTVDSSLAAAVSRTFTVSGYPTLPQTGQDFTLIYVLGACCLAAAAAWVVVYAKKKKNNVA